MSQHIVLLPQVELTTASVLRVTENAVAANLTVIDPATGAALAETKHFYLRGDGADDDLLQVLIETVQSHTGANTYTGTVTWSTDPESPCATVTITRATGTNNFQLNWSHASTTLDPLLFGFADADTANDGTPKASTLSPLAAWVSPQPPSVFDERRRYDASVNRARSGRVRGTRRAGPYNILDLSFALCDSRRVLRTANTTDPAATFMSLLEQVGDGTSFEIHLQTVTGSAVDALTVYTRKREYWRFDEQTSATFAPERSEPALSLYAWDLVAHGYGETTFEVPPELPAGPFLRWLLDEGAGASVIDSSGNSREGVLTDTGLRTATGIQFPRVNPATGQVRVETAAESGQAVGYHTLGFDDGASGLLSTGLTLSFMWTPTEAAWSTAEVGGDIGLILGNGPGSAGSAFRIRRCIGNLGGHGNMTAPGFIFILPVSGTYGGGSSAPKWSGWVLDQEHHMMARFNFSTNLISLWADGVKVSEMTITWAVGMKPTLSIGQSLAGTNADGCHIRDVIAYERTLTDDEMATVNDVMVHLYG